MESRDTVGETSGAREAQKIEIETEVQVQSQANKAQDQTPPQVS
jgi:hypothetical protein